ncbi:MAG: DUF4190 domain-containing protein [Phycisphaerales bacterium]|nr:DUF4190 domain-containing protein [Phycisphaerales bacterium]
MTGVPPATAPRGSISAWAVLSLVTSLGMCPIVTVFSIPLGLLGLRDVRVNGRRGRTVAWIGLIIGLLVTPLTSGFLIWWNAEIRIPLIEGPRAAIQSGMAGDIPGFEAAFIKGAGGETEEDAARFLATIRTRWGEVVGVTQDASREAVFSDDHFSVRVPYIFEFTGHLVPGEAEFVVLAKTGAGRELMNRFAWVLIGVDDPVAWPPSAVSEERIPLPPRSEPDTEKPDPDG